MQAVIYHQELVAQQELVHIIAYSVLRPRCTIYVCQLNTDQIGRPTWREEQQAKPGLPMLSVQPDWRVRGGAGGWASALEWIDPTTKESRAVVFPRTKGDQILTASLWFGVPMLGELVKKEWEGYCEAALNYARSHRCPLNETRGRINRFLFLMDGLIESQASLTEYYRQLSELVLMDYTTNISFTNMLDWVRQPVWQSRFRELLELFANDEGRRNYNEAVGAHNKRFNSRKGMSLLESGELPAFVVYQSFDGLYRRRRAMSVHLEDNNIMLMPNAAPLQIALRSVLPVLCGTSPYVDLVNDLAKRLGIGLQPLLSVQYQSGSSPSLVDWFAGRIDKVVSTTTIVEM